MNLNSFMRTFSEEINGTFSEYDDKKSIIVVPLPEERFQTVLAEYRKNIHDNKAGIVFSSKVCEYDEEMDLKNILIENSKLNHSKFTLVDNYIHVNASCNLNSATSKMIKEMILEVANIADEFELKLTGQDVY